MGFRVDVAGLGDLPLQLDRMRDDAEQSRSYVTAYTGLRFGGILNTIIGSHANVVAAIGDHLTTIAGPVAGGTAGAVREAIAYYSQTDAEAAAALDATYRADPSAPASPAAPGRRRAGFIDEVEPCDRLVPPEDHSAEFPHDPGFAELISPAAFGRSLIIQATGAAARLGVGDGAWDPYEVVLKPICGDWAGLAACQDVFDNVGAATADMGSNATVAASSIDDVWQGNAATAAAGHLTRIASALDATREPLRVIGAAYRTAAEGAHQLSEALSDVLNELIDAVIVFLAEVAVAVATAETVVGGIAGGVAAVYEAIEIFGLVRTLVEMMATLNAIAEALASAGNDFGVVDADVALPPVPVISPALPTGPDPVAPPRPGRAKTPQPV